MAFYFRHAFVSNAFPKNLAGTLVQGVNLPRMFGIIFYRSDIAEETITGFILRPARYRRGHEYFIPQNEGAGVHKPGQLDLPPNVSRFLNVPAGRGGLAFDHSRSAGSPK